MTEVRGLCRRTNRERLLALVTERYLLLSTAAIAVLRRSLSRRLVGGFGFRSRTLAEAQGVAVTEVSVLCRSANHECLLSLVAENHLLLTSVSVGFLVDFGLATTYELASNTP